MDALPEQSLALLVGLCTSAPAGPLSSYLATLQRKPPKTVLDDAVNGLASRIAALWGKQQTEVFTNHRPMYALNEYNFFVPCHADSGGCCSPDGNRELATSASFRQRNGQQLPNGELQTANSFKALIAKLGKRRTLWIR